MIYKVVRCWKVVNSESPLWNIWRVHFVQCIKGLGSYLNPHVKLVGILCISRIIRGTALSQTASHSTPTTSGKSPSLASLLRKHSPDIPTAKCAFLLRYVDIFAGCNAMLESSPSPYSFPVLWGPYKRLSPMPEILTILTSPG